MIRHEPVDWIQGSKMLRDAYEQGWREGILQLLHGLSAKRLHRALTAREQEGLAARAAIDPERFLDKALALEGEALAAWLRKKSKPMIRHEPEDVDLIQVSKTLRDPYEQGWREGILQLMRGLFAQRLHRALTAREQEVLAAQAAIDPEQLLDKALALEGEALAAWLLAPERGNSRRRARGAWEPRLCKKSKRMIRHEPEDVDLIQVSKTLRDPYERGQREGIEKGIEKGIERGVQQMLRGLFARRLHRALSAREQEVLLARAAIDPEQLQEKVLALEGEALAAWLLAPETR
jgi:hypothetical protein